MSEPEAQILAQIDVPLRAQPGKVKIVDYVPRCTWCDDPGIFDFSTTVGAWAHGCLWHFVANRSSEKLGVGQAQLWITRDQAGLTTLPRG